MDASDSQFEILNGRFVEGGSPLFSSGNRAFRYGDGVFETIRVSHGHPLFIQDHWRRLKNGLNALSIPLPVNFDLQILHSAIQELLENHNQEHARFRLVVYREATGFYKPIDTSSSWHLSVSGPVEPFYQISEDGLSADVFEDDYKTCGQLSNLKTLNSLIYVCAGVTAVKNGFDDLLIKNHKGHIIESINSNLFLRKGTLFTTPPLSEGCLDGVMRKQVIDLLTKNHLVVTEAPVILEDVLSADELILTNVIQGANRIRGFRGKIYENDFAIKINGWLNEVVRESVGLKKQ